MLPQSFFDDKSLWKYAVILDCLPFNFPL